MTCFKEKRVKFQLVLYCFLIPFKSNHMVVIYIYTKWVLIFQFQVTWIMVFGWDMWQGLDMSHNYGKRLVSGSCLLHECLISHGEDICFWSSLLIYYIWILRWDVLSKSSIMGCFVNRWLMYVELIIGHALVGS